MKYSLPILTAAVIAIAAALLADKLPGQGRGGASAGRETPDPAAVVRGAVVRGSPDPAPVVVRGSPDPAPAAPNTSPGKGRGAQNPSNSPRETATVPQLTILAASAERLRHAAPLEAKIRQRVDLFGQQLVGAGSYAQAGQGSDRFRLELKIQLADQTTSLTQICDDRYVWTRRDLGDIKRLSRVDLVRVRKAIEGNSDSVGGAPSQWLAIGGLTGLLDGLESNFDFDEPGSSELGQLPVWVTTGHWKREVLADLLPAQRDGILAGHRVPLDGLPAHLPGSVAVALGRDDYLPLFPYRIEFRRPVAREQRKRGSDREAPLSKPILTIEFFEVRSPAPLDPRSFTYDAGDQEVHDETEAAIARLLGT